MPYFLVNATISALGSIQVEAEDEADALAQARDEYEARDFDVDPGTAEAEFNVSPQVERLR